MTTWIDESVQFYINEQNSPEYPDHVNRAIEANRAIASSGEFTLEHQNGNHTVWTSNNLRIVVTRCEQPTIHIYRNF